MMTYELDDIEKEVLLGKVETRQRQLCPDCHHEIHEPGKCKYDNCGQSGISHSNAIKTDYTRVVTWESFRRGEVSVIDVTHIKPRATGNE